MQQGKNCLSFITILEFALQVSYAMTNMLGVCTKKIFNAIYFSSINYKNFFAKRKLFYAVITYQQN